jgi:hypothetical protein
MTRKLEELFDLPPTEEEVEAAPSNNIQENKTTLAAIDTAIDKIDQALPAVRGLDASDEEMDELAGLATASYKDLMDLGMQVDSRFAAEIFSTAGTMLGHAITAKSSKLNKKLKMIDLQMKKIKLDRDGAVSDGETGATETAHGVVLNRNDLLDRILGKDQKSEKE